MQRLLAVARDRAAGSFNSVVSQRSREHVTVDV